MNEHTIQIESDSASFVMHVDGERCALDFSIRNQIMDIRSVRVPKAVGGRGLAGKLTREALDWANSQSLSVKPTCPYVAAWIERHPDYPVTTVS